MKVKMSYNSAKKLAEQIKTVLAPSCQRIEIAGSIRRQKKTVGDIEIICIPKYIEDMFGQQYHSGLTVLDFTLRGLVESGRLQQPEKDGGKYKQFGIPAIKNLHLDLFITDQACWGVNYAIRTGPAKFSQRLVTQRWKGGLLPNTCHVYGSRLWKYSKRLKTPEEEDFLKIAGGWVEPEERCK